MRQIVYNSVKCLECNKILVSRHVHDCVTCGCPNDAMIDGGNEYTRYGAMDMDKIETLTLTEDDILKIAIDQGVIENEFNWKLIREHDRLTNQSNDIMWIEFNENGTFKEKHDKPGVGRSLLMSPFNQFFTWQTTLITEIVEEKDDYIKFKTKNSNYELWKLKKII